MRNNYENLEVYKRSFSVSVHILKVIDDIRPYRLAEQLIAAAISIPSNIAEGSERNTEKEFIVFLTYSCGSVAELITQLKIIKEAERQVKLDLDFLIKELIEINSMLRSLINNKRKRLNEIEKTK
ncbi:MAG: four helix bundle protein [Bacteroidia bacterium]